MNESDLVGKNLKKEKKKFNQKKKEEIKHQGEMEAEDSLICKLC